MNTTSIIQYLCRHGWEAICTDFDPDKDDLGVQHESYPGLVLQSEIFDDGQGQALLRVVEEAYSAGRAEAESSRPRFIPRLSFVNIMPERLAEIDKLAQGAFHRQDHWYPGYGPGFSTPYQITYSRGIYPPTAKELAEPTGFPHSWMPWGQEEVVIQIDGEECKVTVWARKQTNLD